ncbi:MAG: type II 3-dehydroquinate dehydratase [Synergistales bacterium]|nr:type II 3-dehydroquinate dehydratase [Synergistales bacterium]
MTGKIRILVLNGPNLNLLGEREPHIYGRITLKELNDQCEEWGRENSIQVDCFQSNSEGALIDRIQEERFRVGGIILNAGAYTHYSYALRDCIASIRVPVIEVHLSNPQAREEFRKTSLIGPVARGTISGFGTHGYILALQALKNIIEHVERSVKSRKEMDLVDDAMAGRLKNRRDPGKE